MSLNFASLGASVAIKDLGASKMAATLTSAFSGVSSALSAITGPAGLAAAALGGLGAGAALGKLGDLAGAVANIGTSTRNLTTSFEAEAQAHSVSTRRMIAQTGIFGKELDKANGQAASMAMGMGMSDQTAAHAVATFSQFKDEMKALGVESAVTAGKVEEGMGVSIRDLANQMHRMKDGLKLSQKEMEELGKSFTATGESIHDIAGPFKNMDAVLDLAARRTNLVKQGMSSIGGKESVKSVNKAIQSLYILTGDAKGAQEAALGLEDKLTMSMEKFRDMFTGNASQLDSFLVNTSIVTGDVQKAFAAAANGPDAFIKEFGTVIARLKKDGKSTSDILKFFGGQMSDALGPEMANKLVLALSNADDAKMKMIADTKGIGKSLGDMGKEAWRSTITMQQAFDMMVGSAMSSFRQIGRGTAQVFVKDTKKAFDEFNNEAKKLVKEGGPYGQILQKVSEISNIGAIALVPEKLRPTVAVFGNLYQEVAPALGAFQQLSGAVSGVLNPMTLLTAAVGGFIALVVKNKTKDGTRADAIVGAWSDVKKQLNEWSNKFLEWADNFDWGKVFTLLADGLSDAIKGLTALLSGTGGGSGGGVSFASVGSKIFAALKASFGKQNWGELFKALFQSVRSTAGDIATDVGNALKAIFNAITNETWQSLGKSMADGIKWAMGAISEALKADAQVQAEIWSLMMEIGKIMAKSLPAIYEGFKAGMGSSTEGTIMLYILNPLQAMADVQTFFTNVGTAIRNKFIELWSDVKAEAVKVWAEMWQNSTIPDMVKSGVEHIKEYLTGIIGTITDIGSKIGDIFGGAISKVVGLFSSNTKSPGAAVELDNASIEKSWVLTFDKIGDKTKVFIKDQTKKFQDFAESIATMFQRMWVSILENTSDATKAAERDIEGALNQLNQLKTALEHLAAAQAANGGGKLDESGKIKREGKTGQDLLIDVINKPDWYAASGGYAELFERKMAALIEVVGAARTTPTSSSGQGETAGQAATRIKRQEYKYGPGAVGSGNPLGGVK